MMNQSRKFVMFRFSHPSLQFHAQFLCDNFSNKFLETHQLKQSSLLVSCLGWIYLQTDKFFKASFLSVSHNSSVEIFLKFSSSKKESSFVRSRPTSSSGKKSSVHTQTGEADKNNRSRKTSSRIPSNERPGDSLSRENQLKLNEAFLTLADKGESPKVEKSDLKKVFTLLG